MPSIEDLVKALQAAAEAEALGRNGRPQPRPVQTRPESESFAPAVARRPRPAVNDDVAAVAGVAGVAGVASVAEVAGIPGVTKHVPAGADRLRRLLRQGKTLRELVVLKELLDRPVAMRRR